MQELFKNIAYGIAGVIATAFVAVWWNSSEEPHIKATYSKVEFKLNPDLLSANQIETIQNWAKETEGIDLTIREIVGPLISGNIYSVEVRNEGEIRTKQFELSSRFGLMGVGSDAVGSRFLVDMRRGGAIDIGPLDPGESVTAIVLSESSYFDSHDLALLHDGRLVPIQSMVLNLSESPFGLISWMNSNVVEAEFLFLLVSALFIFFIFVLIGGALTANNTAFWAKVYSRKDIERFVKVIDYVKEHYPEKAPSVSGTNKDTTGDQNKE